MQRFLVFSLVYAAVGALFVVLCAAQGMAALMPIKLAFAKYSGTTVADALLEAVSATWQGGALAGAIVGCGVALWDLIRNKREQTPANRLVMNMAWCLFYAALFLAVNDVAIGALSVYYASNQTRPSQVFIFWPFVSALLVNLMAVFWAGLRSVNTNNVLTPRVLRDKLRERMRLG